MLNLAVLTCGDIMGFPMWKVKKNRGQSSTDVKKAVSMIPKLIGSGFDQMKEGQALLDKLSPLIETGKTYNSIGLCSKASIYAYYVLGELKDSANPFIKSLYQEVIKEGILPE